MTIREAFVNACHIASAFIGSDEVGAAWAEPSALAEMTVGDLTGHLTRSVTSVLGCLERPAPEQSALVDAPGYFLSFDLDADIDSVLHRAVRERATRDARDGHRAVLEHWRSGLEALWVGLDRAPADRVVAALGGVSLQLDEYLITRLVEVVAHTDDLAASVGLDPPVFDSEATGIVADCLSTVARRKHGDLAVVRAMIRRERDQVRALRVF